MSEQEQDALSATVKWIREASQIVFLTGVELSLEVGLPDVSDLSFNPDIGKIQESPGGKKRVLGKR